MSWIPTAGSSHKKCFICGRKTGKFFKIKKESMCFAYAKHKILIKHHALHCGTHVDEYGFIRKDEFCKIPSKIFCTISN